MKAPMGAVAATVRFVAQEMRVSEREIYASRRREPSLARHVACWIAYKKHGQSFHAISRVVGHKDHTAIIYAVDKIDQLRLQDAGFATLTGDLLERAPKGLCDEHTFLDGKFVVADILSSIAKEIDRCLAMDRNGGSRHRALRRLGDRVDSIAKALEARP